MTRRRLRSFIPGVVGRDSRLEPRRLCDADMTAVFAEVPPLNPGLYNPNDPSQPAIAPEPESEPDTWQDGTASDGGDWAPTDAWQDGASSTGDWGPAVAPVPQTAVDPYA